MGLGGEGTALGVAVAVRCPPVCKGPPWLWVGGAAHAAESEGAGLGVLRGGPAGGSRQRWAGPVPAGIHGAREPGACEPQTRSPRPRAQRTACLPRRPCCTLCRGHLLGPPPCAPPAALDSPAAMVAGMLMPLDQLRAIYEVLFREGVMVAKKDRRPCSLHPHVPGVTNLQVMRAMASLRARGLVRETFAWRHFYWYLTNEGIAHLRQYLHLPPEIVPASLQRVRRPVAMVMPARRTPHMQAIQGSLGCPPKQGPLPAEDPAREERWVYRRKEPEERASESPVVPATTTGTLARPGPEPAPATGSCVLAPEWGMGGAAGAGRGVCLPGLGGLGWPASVQELCSRQQVACSLPGRRALWSVDPHGSSSWLEDLGVGRPRRSPSSGTPRG